MEVPLPELLGSIFPWIEEEELVLADHVVRFGKVAKDEALVYFLNLLKYLRTVLMQDAAVLCSAYSNLPIFRFAPFDTQTFKTFSATSTQIIKNAESDAHENLKNLPEQYAMSIQGFMKTALLKQELHQTLLEESNSGLKDDIGQMKDVINAILVLQGKATSRGVKRKVMEDLSALISCVFKRNIPLVFAESILNKARPAPPPPLLNRLGGSTPSQSQNPSTDSTHDSGALDPPIPLSSSSSPSSLHQSQIVVSGNGNIYPITMFPLSQPHPNVYIKQMTAISKLEGLFPTERLKQHNF